jgi:hypothetical protein
MNHPADLAHAKRTARAEASESAADRAADEIHNALMAGRSLPGLSFARHGALAVLRSVIEIEPSDMAEHIHVEMVLQARRAAQAGCAAEAARLLTAVLSDAANEVAEAFKHSRADYLMREGEMERAVNRAEYMEDR